jgi:acyl-CoA synthetase (AMP-forming)/AMP-acid ligase II
MLDRSDGPSLRSGFIRNARESPHAIAIVARDRTYTYEELDIRARKWAGTLISTARARLERIAIFAYRSEVAYTGTLAALYAGATYVR